MNVVVRLPNWLGDTVMAVPTLQSLRIGVGESGRVAVAGPWAGLLAGQGLAHDCVIYPRAWTGRLRTADTVARLRPDVVLVLPGSIEAALSAWYWGAARRIGYDTDGRGLVLTDRVPLAEPRLHQIDEYLALLEPLGLTAVTRSPILRAPDDDECERRVEALLASVELHGGPVVGVHLGAAFGPSKLWLPDRVAALCGVLARRGLRPVLLGTAGDRETLDRVREHADRPIATLVGRDSPALLPTLLARLDALVSGDTGAAHLAAALGRPVVVLFGPTDPARSAPRGRVTTIHKGVACAPCFYARCPIEHICMRAIGVDEVADAVEASVREGSGARR